jgi:hypothetical protein
MPFVTEVATIVDWPARATCVVTSRWVSSV